MSADGMAWRRGGSAHHRSWRQSPSAGIRVNVGNQRGFNRVYQHPAVRDFCQLSGNATGGGGY